MKSYLSKKAILYVKTFSSLKQHMSTIWKTTDPRGERGSSSRQGEANKRRQPHGLLLDLCRWPCHVQLVPNLGIVFNWSPLDYQKATAE